MATAGVWLRCVVCLLLSLVSALSIAQQAPAWPEWRGGARQGRADCVDPPTRWDSQRNVRWKTAIPGEGHSSPIVADDAVYVTTAEMVPEPQKQIEATLWLLTGLLALGAFATGSLAARVSALSIAGSSVRLGLATLATLVAAFGQSAIDFQTAPERGWAAAGLFATLLLSIAAIEDRRLGWGLVALSAALAGTVPDLRHTVLENPISAVSCFIYVLVAWPMLLGVGFLLHGKARRALLAFGIVLPWLLAVLIGLFGGGSKSVYTTSSLYEPRIRIEALAVVAAVSLVLLRLRRRGEWFRRTSVLAMAVAGLVLFGVLVEALLKYLPYLHYVVRDPELNTILAVPGLLLIAVSLLAGLGVAANDRWRARAASALAITALAGSTVYFVYARFIPKWPHLEREIVCVDRSDGRIRWISDGVSGERGEMNRDNSPATPTPATDGERIYAYYGTPGILCVDRRGRTEWRSDKLPFQSRMGVASSPILHNGKLFILSESDAGRWLACFDSRTGKRRWKTTRNKPVHSYAGNCRTPSVLAIRGEPTLVVWGYEDLTGYDPASGAERWSYPIGRFGPDDNPVTSLVDDGKRLFLCGTARTLCLAVDLLGSPKLPVEWDKSVDDGAQCASPIYADGRLYAVSDMGSAYCTDAATGRPMWRRGLGSQHYSSPIKAAGYIYFTGTLGAVTVLNEDGGIVARNDMKERILASPAVVGDEIVFRSERSLWCVGEEQDEPGSGRR